MVYQKQFDSFYQHLIKTSIEVLRHYEPADQPYYGLFSGGKDSVAIKALASEADVQVEWHYHVTTIDPPELVKFIRKHHSDVIWNRPKRPFFAAAREKGFPTRHARWCCNVFKESRSAPGRRLLLGIRAAESSRRRNNWATFTYHRRSKEYAVLPLLHWRDEDVWQYIRDRGLPYCSLYDEGFQRLGCIGCPMAGRRRLREFQRWPAFERAWKKLFQDVWKRRSGTKQRDGRQWFGDRYFSSWEEMWKWWLYDEPLGNESCDGQMLLW